MIWLTEETKRLVSDLEAGISKELMMKNWGNLIALSPLHSGSPEEEEAVQFLRSKLEEYGLEPRVLRFEAYISDPKHARLEVLEPVRMGVQCTPYRQVGSTGPDGIEGEVSYIPPEELGYAECRGKIVLCEQQTAGDWMGLRDGFLLRLQGMGVRALIVIEQDDYMPTVVHQRADFSVSGNPTPDNIGLIQTIPAIVHVSNRDGASLRKLAKQGGMRARVTSVVETGWKTLPLLVAEIRGRVEPERFILVNGHVDTPPFSPGVTDNLSGNVAMLEIARLLSVNRDRLRRSVRFAFWTGHETGRYAGSTWYNDEFWQELRHGCVCSYNIDSPGAEGATEFRAVQVTEAQEAAAESVRSVTGKDVESFRWATRAGDGSFWGTGTPHVSVTSSRPRELYDPHVNYSGGGWWWHTPYATMEHGDIDVLTTDVRVELNFIARVTNCPVIPFNFTPYAENIHGILTDLQARAEKVRPYFNLDPVIERAAEFRELSEKLEEATRELVDRGAPEGAVEELNRCLIWVGRHVNPAAHSNAGPSEQMTMETFGATPFPRISGILELAEMTLHQSPEFKLLRTKLIRQRNIVEEGFHQANELIKETLKKVAG